MAQESIEKLRSEGIQQIRAQQFGSALNTFKTLVSRTGSAADLRWQAMSNLMCENFSDALIDLHGVLGQHPNCAFSNLAIAFILASGPNEQLRNGFVAVKHALAGFENIKEPTWRSYSILAAAYAEDGEFEKAIQSAEQMLDVAPEHFRPEAKRRIGDYSLGLTYTATREEIRESMGFLEYDCTSCKQRTFVVWMGEDGHVERCCDTCATAKTC